MCLRRRSLLSGTSFNTPPGCASDVNEYTMRDTEVYGMPSLLDNDFIRVRPAIHVRIDYLERDQHFRDRAVSSCLVDGGEERDGSFARTVGIEPCLADT